MKRKPTRLDSVRIRNFKAIRDSGAVKLTPLTVLIGNNGSGKSSLVEALETAKTMVVGDLDRAMQLWRGIEHIRHMGQKPQYRHDGTGALTARSGLEFHLRGRLGGEKFTAASVVNERGGANEVFFESESVQIGPASYTRPGELNTPVNGTRSSISRLGPSYSLLTPLLGEYIGRWQFLRLSPQEMGRPRPQTRSRAEIQLATDGSNVAEYLLEIRSLDPEAFEGIIETLQFVLPYASDMQPTITTELERAVYLQMSEADYKVPGWLLSTGTLRVLALLACLRHPSPPPLLVIEELENGLDPRTIHLFVEEIRAALADGEMQIIVTTHSPFLLDLFDLSHLVVVERVDGRPTFTRPGEEALAEWSKSFSPGRLYTMGRLTRGGQ
ncbi:MAG: chromosome segregation protein SMC [Planctomycetes bacterium]|nr:chromosome segregation protein SMC [Planctomycetota bacterium]